MAGNFRTHSELVRIAKIVADSYEHTIASIYDKRRHELMLFLIKKEEDKLNGINKDNYDDGILGRVIELFCRDSKSTLCTIRPQGKCDCYIPTSSGKRVKAEIKTRGGDVTNLFDMSEREQEHTLIVYFNYTRIPTKKSAKKKRAVGYYDDFKIMKVSDFIVNAKIRPNTRNGYSVEPTSKVMHDNLEQFEDFIRNKTYDLV